MQIDEPISRAQQLSFHVDALNREPAEGADEAMAMLVGLLDLQAQLPSIQRIRRWGHEVLAVGQGERVLDIGSGTGSEVREFAERVGPDGEAVGVDPNPAMLAVARERTAAAGTQAGCVEFVEGSAYRLPFADGHFDAVRCERVYQHLDDPDAATAEIARVLHPGGRVLLIDSDWHTAILHPGDTDVVRRLSDVMLAATPNPASGRRLRGLLAAAGFVIDDMGSEAVIWEPETLRPFFAGMGETARDSGAITQQEHENLVATMDAGIAAGDYHLSVTMFAVLAHLPQ
ncbi:methyltransferase domain-containing protein [Nocardia donostiensis]|uniref:methyltransferase domain-containing protein n=1 Tax=Nocardia donostiensis TaxID=1538463 RepID=UPI0009DA071C|nr:methyltransferase domain-containing protein [Nocardia donostiensis]